MSSFDFWGYIFPKKQMTVEEAEAVAAAEADTLGEPVSDCDTESHNDNERVRALSGHSSANGTPRQQQHPKQTTPMYKNSIPSSVSTTLQFMRRKKVLPRHAATGCFKLDVCFQITESAIQSGRLGAISTRPHVALSSLDEAGAVASPSPLDFAPESAGGAPYALAIVVDSYNTQLPFDTQLSLSGFSMLSHLASANDNGGGSSRRGGGDDSCAGDESGQSRGSSGHQVREHVLQGSGERGVGVSQSGIGAELLKPRVFYNSARIPVFTSEEAIGFDSEYLRTKVCIYASAATNRSKRYAKLFASTLGSRPLIGPFDPNRSRFVRLPASYAFSVLMARVHMYLTEQALIAVGELEGRNPRGVFDLAHLSMYALPTGRNETIYIADEFDVVVKFIDGELVDVHPIFDHTSLAAALEPFEHDNWVEAWSKTASAAAMPSVAMATLQSPVVFSTATAAAVGGSDTVESFSVDEHGIRRPLECRVSISIFFARYTRQSVVGEFQLFLRLRSARAQERYLRTIGAAHSPAVDLIRTLDRNRTRGRKDVEDIGDAERSDNRVVADRGGGGVAEIQSYGNKASDSDDEDDDDTSIAFTTDPNAKGTESSSTVLISMSSTLPNAPCDGAAAPIVELTAAGAERRPRSDDAKNSVDVEDCSIHSRDDAIDNRDWSATQRSEAMMLTLGVATTTKKRSDDNVTE